VLDFDFELPGGKLAQFGIELDKPRRRVAKHPLVLKADLTSSRKESPRSELPLTTRWQKSVRNAGRSVHPRLKHDFLARFQGHFLRRVAAEHVERTLGDRLTIGIRHGGWVLIQEVWDVLELHGLLADVADADD
jgi:hypothetical protein